MADISKITIPNGNSTSTYDLKDSNAVHDNSDFSKVNLIPVTGLSAYSQTTLGATSLTSVGTVTIDDTSVTKYKLNLTGVINGLTATGQEAVTINTTIPSGGQQVLTYVGQDPNETYVEAQPDE